MSVRRSRSAQPVARDLATLGSWPGLRTLRSRGFRLVLAATLLAIGVSLLAVLLVRQAADPAGQYAFDFQVYHDAAAEISAGRSPYAAEMFTGPIPAQGALLYKYPPVLAQLLVPLTGLSLSDAALLWLVLQAASILAGVWLAALAGGAPRTMETLLWGAVAATLFLPCFDTLWKGNVSGVQALQVALMAAGGAVAGASVAGAILLKTTPVVLILPALLAGRRLLLGLVALGLGGLALSVAASPQAWLDFIIVIPNLIAGPAAFPTNLAPDAIVALALPDMPAVAVGVRMLSLIMGLFVLAWSGLLARRQGGWPAALTLAVGASLILPSSIWYHYLAVLLPIAALAWWRASRGLRLTIAGSAALISLALFWLPLALVGAVTLVAAAARALWPRPPATARVSG